jgi:hypothetical protein
MKTNSIIKIILGAGILFSIFYFLFSTSVMAQVKLETGLPNIPGGQLPKGQELPSYINYFFIFGLSLIAFLALTQMMIGGLTYILAAGNVAKIEDAKDTIKQALLGLGLLLVSYLLLYTINPDLVNLRNPNLAPTQFKGQTQTSTAENPYMSGPTSNAEAGKPCSPNGIVSMPGYLLCQDGQWTVSPMP